MKKDFECFRFIVSVLDALQEGIERRVGGECRHC